MAGSGESLSLEEQTEISKELNLGAAVQAKPGEDTALDQKADQLADALCTFDPNDVQKTTALKEAVEQMGYKVQREAARQSDMLKQPVKSMMRRSEDGGEVAKALIDLKLKIEELDPSRFDFSPGWFARMMGSLPFVGTPLKRYFTQFESAQTVIDAIIKALEIGREGLKRDNITLIEDQKRMREMTHKIEKAIKLGQLLDQKIDYRLQRDIPQDDPRHKFIQEEILFALRQRVMDLQQQLAVNQQGVLATEIIIRNNKELVRGVNRALNVTVGALQVAVTVAMALENQKVVLDKVTALSSTTDQLIANTAARLKTQGADIHKQASSTQLNLETLKKAFGDINSAMEDIANFRRNALPKMAQSILEMDQLTSEADAKIKKMEQGNRQSPVLNIDLE